MIIIPARLHSTRFPQKMLTDVLGYPMIIRSAFVAQKVDEVVVATDSHEIQAICQSHNIPSILTSSSHTSGTDRCAEAGRLLGLGRDEILINMQGDEPFLESEILQGLREMMGESQAFMGTCVCEIDALRAQDPNLVKVILDRQGFALYFSRSPIPFDREGTQQGFYYGHLGIYSFRHEALQEFCRLPRSPLEEIEKLEQLRALWNQKSIQTLKVTTQSIGIDTEEDKSRAIEQFLNSGRIV